MFGITDFRWFNDETVRDARAAYNDAHNELQDYSDHYADTHPRDGQETPEYLRLNEIAWDARQDLRAAKP